jgi:hypothetical protein
VPGRDFTGRCGLADGVVGVHPAVQEVANFPQGIQDAFFTLLG